jgi:Mg-chelatase subunit ChlD
MAEPAGDGRTKIDAARDGVGGFLGVLDRSTGDQVAVISFNADAKVEQRLTDDIASLRRALATIDVGPQTSIASGVIAAHEELVSVRHRASNAPVMVLLSDGFANPDPPHIAVQAADRAKAAGVEVFTIGLGLEYDEVGLRSMASDPAHFFGAAQAADLAGIYQGIARTLPGPATCYWGRR